MNDIEKELASQNYTAENIQVFEGLEAVQKTTRNVHWRRECQGITPPGIRSGRQFHR